MIPRALVLGLPLLWVLGSAPFASADPAPEPTRADALFNAAKQLRDAGLYEDACPKFAETEQIDPGVGVMLYLADCYQHTGHSAKAWAEFRKAEKLARDRNDKRADTAKARADALEAKINRLTIAVADVEKHPGLEVAVDGTPIPPDNWNTPLPTDPGDYSIAISSPGQTARTLRVHLDEGSAVSVPVFGDPTPSAPSAAPASPAPAEALSSSSDSIPHSARGRTRTYVGLGLLGVGAVGVTVGAAFLDAKNQAVSKNETSGAGTLSAISFAVGGAAFTSAIVLYLTAPKDPSSALALSPATVGSGSGAVLRGSF